MKGFSVARPTPIGPASVGGAASPPVSGESGRALWPARLAAGIRARGVVVVWLALVLFFWAWAGPAFFSLANARLVANASATTAIFGAALGLCVLAGSLDLSVPGTAAVAGVVCAKLLAAGAPAAVAVAAAIGIGIACGVVNALLIQSGLNPLAVTIGTLTALGGIAALLSANEPVLLGTPSQLAWLGTDTWWTIPAPVFVVAVIYLLGWLLLSKTFIGIRLLAVGGNADGARRIGVRAPAYRMLGFTLSGICAAIGGVVVSAVISQANPTPDTSQLFEALTAVALSGIALSGGRGSFLRIIIGALIIATVNSGLIIHGLSPSWATFATGALLIGALGFDRVTGKLLGFARRRDTPAGPPPAPTRSA
jgi:ribose transport system permease protein